MRWWLPTLFVVVRACASSYILSSQSFYNACVKIDWLCAKKSRIIYGLKFVLPIHAHIINIFIPNTLSCLPDSPYPSIDLPIRSKVWIFLFLSIRPFIPIGKSRQSIKKRFIFQNDRNLFLCVGVILEKNLDNCKNGNILFCQPASQPDHNFTSLMSLSRKRKWRAAVLLSKMPNKNIITQFSLGCSWSTYSTRKRHTTLYTKITI